MTESPRSVLVTGGAGFVGSALVRRLVGGEGARVTNLDALTYAGTRESVAEVAGSAAYRFVHADVCDAVVVRRAIADCQPQWIVHLAAESHVDRSIDEPAPFVRTNVLGTATMLDEALRFWRTLDAGAADAFRFVHVSTDEVYGSLGPTGRFTEGSPYRPTSPYAATKAGADHLARTWLLTYGLPVVISSCTNNYGPFQFPEKFIPTVIRCALAGEPIPVYGAGDQVRDWLYVDDHVEALLAVARRGVPGETYNIGGGNERRNLDVVRSVCAVIDEMAPSAQGPSARLIAHVADRPGHDRRYAVDAGKAAASLGWRPRESFASGIRRTVSWYLRNREWTARLLDGAYRGERLGLGARP